MEEKQRRRKTDKMADKAQAWISTMWPILVCIVGIVYHSATFKANVTAEMKTMNHDLLAEIKAVRVSQEFESSVTKEKLKRAELRTVRLENSIISSDSKLTSIDKKIDSFVSQLKYIYPTKAYVDKELKKKVDLDRIDKRNLKN